jgi:SAM-dependent methyltransferase
MQFHDRSYLRHAAHFERDLSDPDRLAIGRSWFDTTTTDYWRHARTYEAAAIFRSEHDSRWLTVGDGRYGLDAIRLRGLGFRNVLPTDISNTLLERSRREGRIDSYKIENAEALSFDDETFDYVFCKESYHHFPRPAVALYQMLRVARKAVILVEPNDLSSTTLSRGKQVLKNLFLGRRHYDSSSYEESGNFIYSISPREIEKVALGLNLPAVASKGLASSYIAGCEFEPATWRNATYRRIRLRCFMQDMLAVLALHNRPLLMSVIFKQSPLAAVVAAMSSSGWTFERLPRNPYSQPIMVDR